MYKYLTCRDQPSHFVLSLGELLLTKFASMDIVLTNALPMSLSTFMKEDMVYTTKLAVTLSADLLSLDPHELPMDDYMEWTMKVEGWCNNLSALLTELQGLQVIVAKKRVNIPINEDHIDG